MPGAILFCCTRRLPRTCGMVTRGGAMRNCREQPLLQKPTALQLIPAKIPELKDDAANGATAVQDYEPGEDEVLGFLLTRNISTQVFRGLLENSASEQGARMSAMDNATRNAGDMINKLTIKYNRLRQANITKELIEIISGAEAL